jgi:fused signal recognition particle receptor
MNQESSEQVGQLADIQSAVLEWSNRLEQYVSSHPREVVQVGQVVVLVVLVSLLVMIRRGRRLRAEIRRQAGEIARLAARLELADGQRIHTAQAEATPGVADAPAALAGLVATDVESSAFAPSATEHVVTEVAPPAVIPAVSEEQQVAYGLQKSRAGFLGRLAGFLSGRSKVDAAALEDLEEILILSDVGARCASDLVQTVRNVAHNQGSVAPAELTGLLQEGILNSLVSVSREHRIYQPTTSPLVVLVVGVNGVGKTTTVAKLATKYMAQGKKVLAIAADTFRAAAVEQLAEWSSRVGFTLVRGAEEAKPSAVVFDGMKSALEGGYDVVLIDTAGRLHTKSNLMQELEGIRNVIRKHVPDGPHETILVLDGVSGQNALSQAREFNSAVSLSGLVVTKLDGTPKGGIIIAISQELHLPVFFIGVGEKVDDLVPFDKRVFVEALFKERPQASAVLESKPQAQVGNT